MTDERTLVVSVTEPRGVVLPPVEGAPFEDEVSGKRLLPGENDVSVHTWEAVQKNPAIIIYLRAGILHAKPGKAAPLIEDWEAVSIQRLAEIVVKIEEIPKLNEIKKKVKGKQKIKVIEARIDALLTEMRDEVENVDGVVAQSGAKKGK